MLCSIEWCSQTMDILEGRMYRSEYSLRIKPGKLNPALLGHHEAQIRDNQKRNKLQAKRTINVQKVAPTTVSIQKAAPIKAHLQNAEATATNRPKILQADSTTNKLIVNTSCRGRSPISSALSPTGPTAGRVVDTSTSVRRYSLFGPNTAPFWEYYIDVPGMLHAVLC